MQEWYYKEVEMPEGDISVAYHIFMALLSLIAIVYPTWAFWVGLLIMLLVVIRFFGGNKNYTILIGEFLIGIFIALSVGLFWWELLFAGLYLAWNVFVLLKHWGWI